MGIRLRVFGVLCRYSAQLDVGRGAWSVELTNKVVSDFRMMGCWVSTVNSREKLRAGQAYDFRNRAGSQWPLS